MLLRNLFEAISRTGQGKTAVVGWGRGMGHKGHMMLASSVITKAKTVGGDPYFVVSRTMGKDDPLSADEKLAIYKKVFPQQGHIFQAASDELPDLTRVLGNLNQQGYTDAVVVVGADQVKAFQYLKNYNGKPDKSGNIAFNFNTLDVISRQETGDPSAGEEGPRATPMRNVLTDPNASPEQQFQTWRDAMSPEVSDDEVRDLMAKAKERMAQFNAPKKKVKETDEKQYHGWEEYDEDKSAQVAEFLYDMNPGLFSRYGDEYVMNIIKKACRSNPQASVTQCAGDVIRHLKQGIEEGAPFGSNYAEQLAQQVFDHNPNIKDENQVLNLGYNISKSELGSRAQGIFRDEDFPSDFVSAYFYLQKQGVAEKMLPKSAFAGSDKNKLGSAAHLKGSMKRPARQGDLVGGMEEDKQRLDPKCWKGYRKAGTKMKGGVRVNNCVPVSEDVENIMTALIEQIIRK